MNTDTQNSKASTVYLCYFLAALVMLVTAWLIVVGIQATEPASPARHAKVAAGVLLILIEGFAFHAASRWQEISGMLRLLGWCVFALQITLMSLSQIATGTTAGKVVELSAATVNEVRAQANESRKTAQTLRDSADRLNKSKHGWLNQQGAKTASEAAAQTAAATGTLDKLDKLQAVASSTPIVQLIGQWGLVVLSFAISMIFELSGVALMHTAGKLSRRADSQPVDQKILGMLQQMRGDAPASPALPAAPAKQEQTPAPAPAETREEQRTAPVTETPAFGFIPNNPKQAWHNAPESGELWTAPRREYFLAEEREMPEQAAPVSVPKPEQPAPACVPKSEHHTDPAVLKPEQKKPTESEQPKHTPAAKTKRKTIKTRAAAASSKIDTGTTGKAAGRYNRIKAAVAAGTLKPSVRAIQEVEGGSNEIVMGYQSALVRDGVIKLNGTGRGYELVKPADKSQLALEV